MGCFFSCFRLPEGEEYADGVVSNNHAEGDVSTNKNCAPLSYVTQFFKNKYGAVSSNAGLLTISSSAQERDVTTTEVGTNVPQSQGYVGVTGNGARLCPLQLEHKLPAGHNAQVKGPHVVTAEVGTNTPQVTIQQNSSSSRTLALQGHVAVQGNSAGSGPLQLDHWPPEGRNTPDNQCNKSKDNVNLSSKSKVNAVGFSKDNKAEARPSASPANLSTEKVKTEHKDYFCLTRDEVECPTCLEDYTDENPKITSKCSHHFHLGCIYEWMERSSTCPICSEEMKFDENI